MPRRSHFAATRMIRHGVSCRPAAHSEPRTSVPPLEAAPAGPPLAGAEPYAPPEAEAPGAQCASGVAEGAAPRAPRAVEVAAPRALLGAAERRARPEAEAYVQQREAAVRPEVAAGSRPAGSVEGASEMAANRFAG